VQGDEPEHGAAMAAIAPAARKPNTSPTDCS
jgi:hypothetical protein